MQPVRIGKEGLPQVVERMISTADSPIVFYDGTCGFCNRSVQWLLARDRRAVFRFAPLQGETARQLLSEDDRLNLRSMVLLDENGVHRRSTAVLRSIVRLGGMYALARLGFLVPAFVRDAVYDVVARNRHRLVRAADACALPDAATRQRMLS